MHVFDKFKEKEYKQIGTMIENPYIIFEQLQEDKNRLELIQYFYEYDINTEGFNTCMGDTQDNSNIILLDAMESQEYREQVLDIMYSSMNLDSKLIEDFVLEIIDNMEPEKRKQFLQNHSFNNGMTLILEIKYKNEVLMQNSKSSIEELLATSDSLSTIKFTKEQAKKALELYGETMSTSNLEICIEESINNEEDLENMLNKYYARLKEKISSIFECTTLWSYDYKNIEMFVRNFSNDIDENTMKDIIANYNDSLDEAENRIKKESKNKDKIKTFVEHDKEEPTFQYETVCKYYDTKMQDGNFKPKLVNEIIAYLPVIDRLKFVKKYKDKIPTLEVRGVGKEMVSNIENLDVKKVLLEYQDIISSQDIIDIINACPFKQKMELMKLSNLDEEQKNEIVKYAQKSGEPNVSFLELVATNAELQKNNVDKQRHQQDESSANKLPNPNGDKEL